MKAFSTFLIKGKASVINQSSNYLGYNLATISSRNDVNEST